MKIVFYISLGMQDNNELFRYMFSKVSENFSNVHVVAVQDKKSSLSLSDALRRKYKRVGLTGLIEQITGYPFQRYFSKKDEEIIASLIKCLPRPNHQVLPSNLSVVTCLNGDDAVATMKAISPDIIIQAGAGILRSQIFNCARILTINMHHGIAPLIRGINSIYWAMWEREPKWLGATIHAIDDGIDTGNVLAYARIDTEGFRESFPELFVKVTVIGVEHLLLVLKRLELGERWVEQVPRGISVYRSTFSGWKRLWMTIRSS